MIFPHLSASLHCHCSLLGPQVAQKSNQLGYFSKGITLPEEKRKKKKEKKMEEERKEGREERWAIYPFPYSFTVDFILFLYIS